MIKLKNIKKYVYVSAITGALLYSAVLVFAQTQNNTPNYPSASQRGVSNVTNTTSPKISLRNKANPLITQIKDKNKQAAANRIALRLDRLNRVWNIHFNNVLNKLETILVKIKLRTNKASANGKNVSEVTSAINRAELAIETARTQVTAQAQKSYTINTSGVSGDTLTDAGQNSLVSQLRIQFKSVRDQLRNDLFLLRDDAMKTARSAVQGAFQSLSRISDVDKY